ncbi:MAG: hypothetical protein ABL998_11640 [Planctomycetota bacterium]
MKSRPRLLAFLALLLAGSLSAQESAPVGPALGNARRTLSERGRDQLHPAADPLVVVGREQAGNDLRARTPALGRVERVAAVIDPIAAHERALALYEEGAKFHAPPKAVKKTSPGERARTEPTPAKAATSPALLAGQQLPPWWRSLGPVALAAGLVLLLFYRRHGRTLRWR